MENSFTTDDFLGGKIKLRQPVNGYRATSDAVLLAAAADPKPGQKILDAGAGTAAVSLCLAARCPDITIDGIEIQPEMVRLADENIRLNNLSPRVRVVLADIRAKKIDGIRTGSFDWVVSNPPFILENQPSPDKTRDIAHRESDCPLNEWITRCMRYVAARGHFAMINRADRLPEIMSVLYGRLGALKIIPIWTKEGEPAKRVIIIGRKGVRCAATLAPGVLLTHADGTRSEAAEKIMRQGKALTF